MEEEKCQCLQGYMNGNIVSFGRGEIKHNIGIAERVASGRVNAKRAGGGS